MIAALTAWNAIGIVAVTLTLTSAAGAAVLALASRGRPDRCPWCDSPPNAAGATHAAGCANPEWSPT